MLANYAAAVGRKACAKPIKPAKPITADTLAGLDTVDAIRAILALSDDEARALVDTLAAFPDPHVEQAYEPPTWDYANRYPVDLLPEFQRLTFAEQVHVRCDLWLEHSGDVGLRVAAWLHNRLLDNPTIKRAELNAEWCEWTTPLIREPRPFTGRAGGDACRAYWYAVGETTQRKTVKRPHRRRAFKPGEYAACLVEMWDVLQAYSTAATDD